LDFPGKWSAKKLSEYENGKHRFKVDELFLFAQLYGTPILDLLRPPEATVEPHRLPGNKTAAPNLISVSVLNDVYEDAREFRQALELGSETIWPSDLSQVYAALVEQDIDLREPFDFSKFHAVIDELGIDFREGSP
jgi:hypothetical protein